MCKSITEGGQRCAGHTRPAYEAAHRGTPAWDTAATAYATTAEGRAVLNTLRDDATRYGDVDLEIACTTAMRNADTARQAAAETATQTRTQALQAAHEAKSVELDRRAAELDATVDFTGIDPSQWHLRKTVVFDLETTAPDPDEARLVTASMVEVWGDPFNPDRIVAREWMTDPGIEIPDNAAAIHGISTAVARRDGLDPAYALNDINTRMRAHIDAGVPVIAYNGSYDVTCADRESARHGVPGIDPASIVLIDPLVIDRKVNRYTKGSRKLGAVAERLGIPPFDAHNSTADCVATAQIAYRLAEQHESLRVDPRMLHQQQAGWHREWADRMTEWATKKGLDRRFDDRMHFGVDPVRA